MTTPKFTPGPWTSKPSATNDGMYWVLDEHAGWLTTDDDIHEANARLIAAAPECYKLIGELLEFLEPMRFTRTSDDDRAIVLDTEMRALLAKINGEDHA